MKSVDNSCSKSNPGACPAGELTEKHGKIRIGTRQSSFSRKIYMDTSMPMIHFTTKRKLFVVIFHPDKPDTIVGCAQIRKVRRGNRSWKSSLGVARDLSTVYCRRENESTKYMIEFRPQNCTNGRCNQEIMPGFIMALDVSSWNVGV